MDDELQKELAEIEAMFVQTARRMTKNDGSVTFHDLSPATLFFADRPQRVVGHMTAKQFVEEWSLGENSFAEDPPNAVISFLAEGDVTPEDAIVVLRDPVLEGTSITYSIEMLDGSLPASAESCSVFIDPFGRPLSLMSVAGVRRRQRRRGV